MQGPNDTSGGRGAGKRAAAKAIAADAPAAKPAAPAQPPAGPWGASAPAGMAARRVPRQGAAAPRQAVAPPHRAMVPPGQVPRRLPQPPVSELDRSYIRGLRRAIIFLLVLGLIGFLLDGSNRPANPRLVPAADPGAAKGLPAFGSATLTVTSSRRRDACVLEAVTPAQQQAGLMRRTTVAPYAGMAFVFSQLSTDPFWMKETLIPLSVAFFDAGGRYETAATMQPCPPTTKACPFYRAGEPYELAVEVPAGQLKSMGIGPGSTVSIGGACSS